MTKRITLLILIMTAVAAGIGVAAIAILYNTALDEQRSRLVETAQSQARLMEAVARFDEVYSLDYPEGSKAATIAQIKDAHERYLGFGETGEFTLARRVGDDIVFVLRHRHLDLDKPQPVPFDANLAKPMRRALSGQSGTTIGLDYRGVTVLAAHEPVSVLDLGIVAKIDLAEIRAPFLKAAAIVAVIATVLIASGTILFFRVSNPIIRRIRASEERFRQILESAADAILISDVEGRILTANQQAERLFGFARHELIGQPVELLLPEPLRDKHTGHRQAYHAHPKQRPAMQNLELAGRHKDGTLVPLEISLSLTGLNEERMVTTIIRDLSTRKAADAELRRLNRTHTVLSRCNNTLARSVDEVGLLNAFCTNLVEVGGYRFAWVGYAKQNRAMDVRVMAHAGWVDAELSVTKITWSDADDKSSPCGTAIRTGRPVVLRDIEQEPKLTPWRKSALRLGYRSMIALPLKADSHTHGNFSIFATVANAFNDKEVDLLTELAEDLAFGIGTLRTRAAHERKVRLLREDVERDTRKRIAAALHDGVAQSVQGVNLGLKRLRALAAGGQPLQADFLNRIIDDIGGILSELRDVSQELRPLFLERMGLIEAIQYYCSELSESAEMTIRVVAQEIPVPLGERVKEQCFLSFREALTNAIKHANASRVDVVLEALAFETLTLRIADDGVGFDTVRVFHEPAGLGLSMISERAESVGGSAQILSTPGKGTTVTITVPLEPDLGATHDTPRSEKESVET